MPSSAFFTWLDRSREKASMSFRIVDIDETNIVGQRAALATLESALDAVTLGSISEEAIVANRDRLTNITPSDGRRETKWLVRYQDAAEKKVFNAEIPCADEDSMPFNTDSDFVDMKPTTVSAARDALVAAIEAMFRAPNGQAISVISIECVGRNT